MAPSVQHRFTRWHAHQLARLSPLQAAVLALIGIFAAASLVELALAHLAVTLPLLLAAATGAVPAARRWKLRRRADFAHLSTVDPHTLSPEAFESFIAALCERDGCTDVRRVGGANDHAADVLATLPGRRWWQIWRPRRRRMLVQAKRYQLGNAVGNEHVQMVNGTYRDYHGCDFATIVATSHFTPRARQFADRVGIALVDEPRLHAWKTGVPGAAPWN